MDDTLALACGRKIPSPPAHSVQRIPFSFVSGAGTKLTASSVQQVRCANLCGAIAKAHHVRRRSAARSHLRAPTLAVLLTVCCGRFRGGWFLPDFLLFFFVSRKQLPSFAYIWLPSHFLVYANNPRAHVQAGARRKICRR